MPALAQFPSQGDLLKFLYNATGIIPSKKQSIVDLNIHNKSLHRSLDRVAKEEGDFLKNFEEHADGFRSAINGMFSNSMYGDILFDPLIEIFQVYTQTVLTDHTYLDKKKSLSFLINTAFLQRATISIFKYTQHYSNFLNISLPPNGKFWFLEYDYTTPLTRVMNWIYDCEDKNLEVFHDTSKFSTNECIDQIDQDLANVRNWLSGTVKLPPFSNILDVFHRAFTAHKIDSDKKDRYVFFLFIARFATYCLDSLFENTDIKEALKILVKMKSYLELIEIDYEISCLAFDSLELDSNIQNGEVTSEQILRKAKLAMFFKITNKWNEHFAQFSPEEINVLPEISRSPNNFVIKTFKDYLVTIDSLHNNEFEINIKNCIEGYSVMKQKYNYQQWLNEYYGVGNDVIYPWLVHWIDGMKSFCNKEFESSLTSMRKAFDTIRYSAGNNQIRFIEDYMLIALAQPNNGGNVQGWKDFKLAFKWGVFMNHFDTFPEFYNDVSDKELKVIFKDKKQSYKSFLGSSFDSKVLAKLLFHWKYDS